MLYESNRIGEFLVTASGPRSYREKVVSAVATLAVGTVLAASPAGARTVTKVDVAGAGKGVLTLAATPAAVGAPEGVYKVVFIEPAANAGAFTVERPDGTVDGAGAVGAAYDGAVKFTIADGATDFVAGDIASVTVDYAAGSETLVPLTAAGVIAGTQVVAGILWERVAAAGANTTVRRNVVVADAEVTPQGGRIRFPVGADANETAAAKAATIEGLAALGIVVVR